jgi:hypothetical protein
MPPDHPSRPASQPPPLGPWLRARLRIAPNLLSRAAPATRRRFAHAWAPTVVVQRQVRVFPAALQDYLARCPTGWLVVAPRSSGYAPGPQPLRGTTLHHVAYLSVDDLAAGNEAPLHAIAHLIDHHLGCGGAEEGPWFSEGGGPTPGWQEAGARISGLFALGYAVDPVAAASLRDYFAQSLAVYCLDRQRLNVADPKIYRLLKSTLLSDAFWRGQTRSQA